MVFDVFSTSAFLIEPQQLLPSFLLFTTFLSDTLPLLFFEWFHTEPFDVR